MASDPGLDPGEEAPRVGWGPQRALPVGRGPGGQRDDSAGLACESEEEAHGPPRPRDNAFPTCVRDLAEATRISIAEFGSLDFMKRDVIGQNEKGGLA